MFKTLTFLKRKSGLNLDQFKAYYEDHHAPFGAKLLKPEARRYFRRYVTPMPYSMSGEIEEPDFDVITEVWCESRSDYEKMIVRLLEPENAAAIREDETKFLDTSKSRLLLVEEIETNMAD